MNYYANDLVRFSLKARDQMFAELSFPKTLVSETGSSRTSRRDGGLCPVGMQFGKPIYITENGVDDSADELRPRYLVEHLHSLWRVINNNAPVRGYFHWTLVDNFEWERGWTQHFGLWGLDEATQKRIRRPSVDLLRKSAG